MDNKKLPPKPLLVARQEFIDALSNLIAQSELPAFVLHDILKDAESELGVVVARQYAAEKAQYTKQSMEAKDEPEHH